MSRWRVTFWLDDQKTQDYNVGMLVRELKTQRQFSSVVRDGIRLVVDLRAKRLDVLRELFPWIDDALNITPPAAPGDDLKREIETAVKSAVKIAFLEAPATLPPPPPNYPTMKPKTTSAALFDDQDTIIIRRDESQDADNSTNFLKGAFGLNGQSAPTVEKQSGGIKEIKVNIPMPVIDEDDDFVPVPMKKTSGQVNAVQ